jgi:hypothetical protein
MRLCRDDPRELPARAIASVQLALISLISFIIFFILIVLIFIIFA